MEPVRVGVLGPLEVVVDGEPRAAGPPRERAVLAQLALNAGRTVPTDRLVDAVWGEAPPGTARTQVQICVSALRRRLGSPRAIATRPGGYALAVRPDDVDVHRFARLVERADGEDGPTAARTLRTALALWRGPALADVDGEVARVAATALEERRLAVAERRLDLDLDLGRADDLIGELRELVAAHPLRESAHRLLMLALYRAGRPADALAAYRAARRVLAEELGVDPGPELRELERAVLDRDPGLGAPARAERPHPVEAPAVPRMLPAGVPAITGRDGALAVLLGRLGGPPDPHTAHAVPVVGLVGAGGVGKSTLAVRAAHELVDRYPDGQLYADLHQDPHDTADERVAGVLGRFLRALGVADRHVPEGTDERAEVFRTRLAGRRVLVVLDGVREEADVVPLVPGSPGSAVLTTSRRQLTGLPSWSALRLDVLDEHDGVALLTELLGAERVGTQRDDLRALVRACDGLPLALRIAGAKLASRPHWTPATLVERLADEQDRLDELTHRGLEVRSTIGVGVRTLGGPARRLFRRLAALDGPPPPAWAAAALLDVPERRGQDAVAELVEADLVAASPGPGTPVRWHDLVRAYALERLAEEEDPVDRDAAARRVLGGWLVLLERARRREYGDVVDLRGDAVRWEPPPREVAAVREDPMTWVDGAREALVAGVRQAAGAGWTSLCWELAFAAAVLFEIKGGLDDWRETAELALVTARAAGDRLGAAAAGYSSGALLVHQGRLREAEARLRPALAALRDLGHDHGTGLALRQLAVVERLHGDPVAARASSEAALPLLRAAGDRSAEAHTRSGLARLAMDDGDLDTAAAHLDAALRLAGGTVRTEAQIRYRCADLELARGQPAAARDAVQRVLDIATGIEDRVGVAYALYGLGRVERAAGRPGAAADLLDRAVATARLTGDRHLEARALRVLASITDR